jgi:hypothetical protein
MRAGTARLRFVLYDDAAIKVLFDRHPSVAALALGKTVHALILFLMRTALVRRLPISSATS